MMKSAAAYQVGCEGKIGGGGGETWVREGEREF